MADMTMETTSYPRRRASDGDVVLGEDWDRPAGILETELVDARERRGFISLNSSPLARKIVLFNLLAILVLVAGVLFLNPSRDSLVAQREIGLISEARLVADVLEARLNERGSLSQAENDVLIDTLSMVSLPLGAETQVFDTEGTLLVSVAASNSVSDKVVGLDVVEPKTTIITNALNWVWDRISALSSKTKEQDRSLTSQVVAQAMLAEVNGDETLIRSRESGRGSIYTVLTPIIISETQIGSVAISSVGGQIDALVRAEREQVLQMFVIALLVSIGLSLLLASTIANPLSDLSAAAELGRDKHARKMSPNRVRIPDLTARPDEIGRLSGALRGMVSALYDRIDSNEQFAADVAHEIKNPLASLRSAVGTMRLAKTDDQRTTLLDVIDHDVRRLDRLVSDISNASRLDSELVKEEEEPFDLIKMLSNLSVYHSEEAGQRQIDFISDLPKDSITILGLEARLAQVFVNLITNAMSFCNEGDAVRVWARQRENRVLVVVEDTGPGIPEQALTKVFNRFYSERPEKQFGNHSGLGLAISKQIVEAHGGVIWAENIRPTDVDITSEPLGARFVVGLPV